jgi:hypothetical protein
MHRAAHYAMQQRRALQMHCIIYHGAANFILCVPRSAESPTMDAPFGFNMPRARDRGAFGCLSLQSIHLCICNLICCLRVADWWIFFCVGPRAQNELMMLWLVLIFILREPFTSTKTHLIN